MATYINPLGPTPPGTPTKKAEFRANRTEMNNIIQQAIQAAMPAQQIPQPITQTINVVPIAPRVGGVAQLGGYSTCWTGGSLDPITKMNVQTEPASSNAFRSADLSQVLKLEKVCTAGLPETRRLPVPGPMDSKDASSAVTIVTWLREISQAVVDRGLDSVFRVDINGTEVFLLEKWGQATKANVDTHVAWLRAHGDMYDKQNLQLSAKFLKNSLDDELLRRVEQETGTNTSATGPDVFAAVIALHTVINHSTQRNYVMQLQKLKLTKEPGEDVNVFSDKVLSIARHIGGLTAVPIPDLHTLIYQCFEGSTTPTFASTVTNLLADCFKNLTAALDWELNVAYLKLLYRDLVTRSSWIALKTMKEKPDGTAAKATVKSLKAEIKRLTKKSGDSSSSKQLTCYHCGEPGHVKPNCPNKDKPKTYSGDGSGGKINQSNSTPPTSQAKAPPKDGESHTKTVSGVVHKWCCTCKKWNHGDKAHLTADHIKRTPAPAPAPAGNLAQADASLGPALSFVSGYVGCVGDSDVSDVDVTQVYIPSIEEEMDDEKYLWPKWFAFDQENNPYCLLCNSEIIGNPDDHADTVSHYQNSKFLTDMNLYFANKTQDDDALSFVSANQEEIEQESWNLVESADEWTVVAPRNDKKQNKKKDLKDRTGRL